MYYYIMKDIHIGSIIKQKIKENSLTIKEFAANLNLHSTSIYHIFKKETIDIERLKIISDVLGYDFINEIYQTQETEQTAPKQTVFMTIEVAADTLQKLNLPDEFLILVKKQN